MQYYDLYMTRYCSSDDHKEVFNAILLAIGSKVREERERLGYSQESFALKSGFNRSYIGAFERGEQNFTIETLLKIANALEIDHCRLFNAACQTTKIINQQVKA